MVPHRSAELGHGKHRRDLVVGGAQPPGEGAQQLALHREREVPIGVKQGVEVFVGEGVEGATLVHDRPRTVLGDMSALVYGRPSEKMTVIGITGTSGKTTTAYLLEAALTAAGRRTGLIGTIETKIAGARVPSALTTPEAPQLHALFALMLERGLDTVVMEVSSHALSLGRVDGTVFSVAAFTNLSQDHLDFHGTLEDYFLAKSRLFTADSRVRSQSACVCVDDDWGRRMADVAASGVTVSEVDLAPFKEAVSGVYAKLNLEEEAKIVKRVLGE